MILFEAETLEERERHFREAALTKNHEIKMNENVLEDFMDYWTQDTVYKKEVMMLWEKRKITAAFKIPNRMAYWKRNNPPKEEKGKKFPNYWSRRYDISLGDIQKQMDYRKHLRGLGFKFDHSPTAGEIVIEPK